MPNVIAAVTIIAGAGTSFPPGSVVPVETDEEAGALVDAGNATWPEPEPDITPLDLGLPDDLPGRAAFEAAGLDLDAVLTRFDDESVADVDGIGPATVEALTEYFAARDEAGEDNDDQDEPQE